MSVLLFPGAGRRLRGRLPLVLGTAVALLLSMQTWLAPSAQAGIVRVRAFSASGTALYHPYAVATDDIGNVYVADSSNHRIVKFSPTGTQLLVIGQGPPTGQPGQLYYPEGVVFANDHLYVADSSNRDVKVFTTGGTFVLSFSDVDPNVSFSLPDGIAADCAGNIYVANGQPPYVVQRFDGNGNFVDSFGESALNVAVGVAVDSYLTGDTCIVSQIFVSSEADGVIARFAGSGEFMNGIGSEGSGPGQFSFPDQLALERDEATNALTLWVAESGIGNERAQAITSTDNGDSWTTTAMITEGDGHLTQPHGVAVNQQGHVFVVDTGGTSHVFEYKNAAPALHFKYIDYKRRYIKDTKGLWFNLSYNQLSKTCKVLVKATVTVPPNALHVFTVDQDAVVGTERIKVKVDLSDRQLRWMKQAWADGRNVALTGKAIASCSGGVRLTKTDAEKI